MLISNLQIRCWPIDDHEMLKLVSALLHFICVIQQSTVCIAEWSNVTGQWAAHYPGAKRRPIFIIRNGLASPRVIKTTNSNTATGNGIIGLKLLGNFLWLRDREGSCRVRHQRRGNAVFTISRDNDGNLVLIWPDPDPVRGLIIRKCVCCPCSE